jgi:hypothetical protein
MHSTRKMWMALLVGAAAGVLAGFALAMLTPGQAEANRPTAYLDAEFDYLGAVETWPRAPGSSARDPFGGEVTDGELVTAGRIVCERAADGGMSFDGMLDLLGFDPHQTYVVLVEAADKLCPSRWPAVQAHLD